MALGDVYGDALKMRKRAEVPVATSGRRGNLGLQKEGAPAIIVPQSLPHVTPSLPPNRRKRYLENHESRMRAAGIQSHPRGPHCLRHACATHLMQNGASLKAIGDLLGHHNADSTRIYAKGNLVQLRRVADFDLRGLLGSYPPQLECIYCIGKQWARSSRAQHSPFRPSAFRYGDVRLAARQRRR